MHSGLMGGLEGFKTIHHSFSEFNKKIRRDNENAIKRFEQGIARKPRTLRRGSSSSDY
jgi:hypothetical protein